MAGPATFLTLPDELLTLIAMELSQGDILNARRVSYSSFELLLMSYKTADLPCHETGVRNGPRTINFILGLDTKRLSV